MRLVFSVDVGSYDFHFLSFDLDCALYTCELLLNTFLVYNVK